MAIINQSKSKLYTLYFSKELPSFKEAANSFLKAVGTIDRLKNSLLGEEPKFFDKLQIVDSKPGTNPTEEELGKYKERLLYIYWAIWGILNWKEVDALAPFMNNFMDGVDVKEENLDKFREILLRAHHRVRRFKTVDGLKAFVMYLRNLVYIAGKLHCPTINSDEEALFYFEPASELAWIAIEKSESGGYKVEGEADFVTYPGGIQNTLKSAGYGFDEVETRLAVSREAFLEKVAEDFREFKMTAHPNGEIRFDFRAGSSFEWLTLEKVCIAVEGDDDDWYYVVKAKKCDNHKTDRRKRRPRKSSGKIGYPVYIG